ncbi:DMT family transporter [Terrisporobacter petrolearius]|uniref:DMT family transporter n=1 Tax=Terrisporobacter petrolearius TaxID=1460447 RepID=UPI0031CC57C6
MKKYKLGLIISMLIWGSIGIFVRDINFTSSQIALVRAIVGSIFLIIFSMLSKESLSKEKIKSNLLVLICCGICLGFNWIFLFQAYHYTTISTATICYYLAPIIVMFLSPILLKEKLNSVKVSCIVAAMIGMLCIVGIDKSSMGENNMVGILYGLSAACFYAGVVILNKFLKGISGRDSVIVQLSVSAIFLLPYVIFTEKISLVGVSSQSIILLLILGVVHTGIAYLLYFTVIQKIESQTVAIYSYFGNIYVSNNFK